MLSLARDRSQTDFIALTINISSAAATFTFQIGFLFREHFKFLVVADDVMLPLIAGFSRTEQRGIGSRTKHFRAVTRLQFWPGSELPAMYINHDCDSA